MVAGISISPRFIPCQPDDSAMTGWHIARRLDWDDPGRFEIVLLDVWTDDRGSFWNVWRAGGSKPESPEQWEFRTRIAGFRCMPDEPIELTATRH
jgi:hypothetical protein